MSSALPALAGSVAAAFASLLGVAFVQLRPGWTRAGALPLAAFSGGVILGAAFLHMLPEAMKSTGEEGPALALAAFFALYVLETHVVPHEHHAHGDPHDHSHDHAAAARHAAVPAEAHVAHAHAPPPFSSPIGNPVPITAIATVAFGLHAAFDGVAIGVGFAPQTDLGVLTTLGVLAHKFPEGIALASLLFRGGMRATRAVAVAAAIAALTPLTTGASLLFLSEGVAEAGMGRLLALIAGAFVYIASADLLPEVAHHPRLSRTALMLLGILVAGAVRAVFG